MKEKQPDRTITTSDALARAVRKAVGEAAGHAPLMVDMKALNAPEEALAGARLGEEQVALIQENLRDYRELIDAADEAVKKLGEAHHGLVESVRAHLRTGDQSIDVDGIFWKLLQSDELGRVRDLATSTKGVRGISLGVSADVSFLIPGWGAGADGIWMFPYHVGTKKIASQLMTRTWTYKSKGIDLLWSAGVVLTFWLEEPVSSKQLLGAFLSLNPITRVTLFGWIPSVDAEELGTIKALKYIFGVTIGPSLPLGVGVEFGVGVLHGKQDLHRKLTLASLAFENTTTLSSVVVIGLTSTLDVTVSWPRRGGTPTRIFRNYTENGTTTQSTMTFNWPSWLDSTLSDMSISAPADWSVGAVSDADGTITLTYTGEDQAAWDDDITFSISNVASDDTTAQSGIVSLKMSNVEGTGAVGLETSVLTASLPLVQAAFVGTFSSWSVSVGSGFSITTTPVSAGTASTSTGPCSLSGSCTVASSADYQDLVYTDPSGDDYTITVTDPDGVIWRIGYVFAQNAGSDSAYLQSVWWKDGTLYVEKNLDTSEKYTLSSSTSTTVTANYDDVANSSNYLEIKATAQAVYASSASEARARRA